MAGDWIKMTTTLHENPRVVDIAEMLKVDELHVVGMLWRVWAWADTQTISGTGMNITEHRINKMVACDGFCDALRAVGWLYGEDRALSFTNFDEHNGVTAKKRALGKNRNEKYRKTKGVDCCDAMGCEDGDADNVTPVTQKVSLEKRREEKSNRRGVVNNTVDGAAAVPSSPTPPQGNDDLLARTRSFIRACCGINSAWGKTKLNRFETVAAADAYNGGAVSSRDVELIAAYYRSKMAMDSRKVAFWRPDGRLKFFECFGDVLAHAVRWARETSWKSFAEMERLKADREAKAGAEAGAEGEAVSLDEFRAALAGEGDKGAAL